MPSIKESEGWNNVKIIMLHIVTDHRSTPLDDDHLKLDSVGLVQNFHLFIIKEKGQKEKNGG